MQSGRTLSQCWRLARGRIFPPISRLIEAFASICASPPPASLSTCASAPAPHAEKEQGMAVFRRGEVWWYKFYFAGRLIRESSKSTSKTLARDAEKQRRREIESGFHNIGQAREQRIRSLKEIIDEYLVGYRLRFRAPRFAKYALGHVSRLLGTRLAVDIDANSVLAYQEEWLREGAAPKSINEEVRFLLKILGDPGEIIRTQLRKKQQLKLSVQNRIGRASIAVKSRSFAQRPSSPRALTSR